MKSTGFYARTGPAGATPGTPSPPEDWQPLRDHLSGVSKLSALLARETGAGPGFEESALWAGALHDIGKYADAFQQVLLAVADGRTPGRVEHSGHGAAVAFRAMAFDVAFAVAAHHAGLGTPTGLRERAERFQSEACSVLRRARDDSGTVPRDADRGVPPAIPPETDALDLELRTRMLLSCLVDADRLDAAAAECTSHPLADASARLQRLLTYVADRAARVLSTPVRGARDAVLQACLEAAEWPERLLSLTVPTGGGKTLASMAFALKRAVVRSDEVRRVIVVIPFLSIIEQNAGIYREAIGEGAVLEHHSGDIARTRDEQAGEPAAATPGELAIENWDAPVVVTTSVRFFESLFSNRPADLRRLHNVARSVVILDEVQTVPRHLLRPLLSMMVGLSRNWGTTFLFCTATQPAFEGPRDGAANDSRWPQGTIREVMPNPQRSFTALKRVTVTWPGERGLPVTLCWEDVAKRLAKEPRVLCVVNLKEHARTLYEKLQEHAEAGHRSVWHLSSRMCPRHRLNVLHTISSALATDGTCRVVATQVVEAGVDLDFPVVFRAMGPLDSVVQAAGRCDREGLLTASAGRPAGRVVVFEPSVPTRQATPPGAYADATDVTRSMLVGSPLNIHDPRTVRSFFHRYYQADLDTKDIEALRAKLDFPEVARRFAMIEDRTTAVLVPYDDEARVVIRQMEERGGFDLVLRRRAQRYQVGLYSGELQRAQRNGAIYELVPGSDIWCCEPRFYTDSLGFVVESDEPLVV